jgi:hypothetical protein
LDKVESARTFELQEALPLLEATPAVLRSLLARLPDDWLRFREEPEAWSPYTVLVHFIHNEKMNWIPRTRVVLSEEAVRKFPPFQQLPEDAERTELEVSQLLDEFARLRQENLSFLRNLELGPDQFDREAEHPALGTVTLSNLLSTWVVHDLNHLHQIAKTLAKRYQAGVGPWKQFLGILEL